MRPRLLTDFGKRKRMNGPYKADNCAVIKNVEQKLFLMLVVPKSKTKTNNKIKKQNKKKQIQNQNIEKIYKLSLINCCCLLLFYICV